MCRIRRGLSVTLAAAATLFLIIFVPFPRVPEHPAAVTMDLRTELYLEKTEATVCPILEYALMHIYSGALRLQVPE